MSAAYESFHVKTACSARRVLVVDDNNDAADLIVELLQIYGFDAISTYDGASALVIADKFIPNVVFCDIGMPGMDGYEVARQMRASPVLTDTHVVALTAMSNESARENVIDAGFHMHLIKPASFEDILLQANFSRPLR